MQSCWMEHGAWSMDHGVPNGHGQGQLATYLLRTRRYNLLVEREARVCVCCSSESQDRGRDQMCWDTLSNNACHDELFFSKGRKARVICHPRWMMQEMPRQMIPRYVRWKVPLGDSIQGASIRRILAIRLQACHWVPGCGRAAVSLVTPWSGAAVNGTYLWNGIGRDAA